MTGRDVPTGCVRVFEFSEGVALTMDIVKLCRRTKQHDVHFGCVERRKFWIFYSVPAKLCVIVLAVCAKVLQIWEKLL